MVDVDPIGPQDFLDLKKQAPSRSLNSKDRANLLHIVAGRLSRVNQDVTEAFSQVAANDVKDHCISSFLDGHVHWVVCFIGVCDLASGLDILNLVDS